MESRRESMQAPDERRAPLIGVDVSLDGSGDEALTPPALPKVCRESGLGSTNHCFSFILGVIPIGTRHLTPVSILHSTEGARYTLSSSLPLPALCSSREECAISIAFYFTCHTGALLLQLRSPTKSEHHCELELRSRRRLSLAVVFSGR